MLFTLIILFVFIYSIYIGVKRGLILQLLMSIGFFISYGVAMALHENLSTYVEMLIPYPSPLLTEESPFALYSLDLLFDMDQPFYDGLSFVILLFLGWIVVRIIGRILDFVTEIKLDYRVDSIGGALLSFFVHYIGLFVILFVLSTLPFDFIQNQIESSWLAETMITKTPELSQDYYSRWVEVVDPEADTSFDQD